MSVFAQPNATHPSRRRTSVRAALLVSTLILPSTAALAQVGPTPVAPPVFTSLDEHGVDIISGKLKRTIASIQIGPGGPGSLTYNWGTDDTVNNQQDVYGFLTFSGSTTTVTIGGSASTFTYASGSYTSDQGDGSTLVYSSGTYTYTSSNGMVAVFSTALLSGSPASNIPKITSLTYPGGEALTYYYRYDPYTASGITTDVYNLKSVTSNLGYQLRLNYSGLPSNSTWKYVSGVTVFNMAVETCDPTAASCTLTGTWPSLAYDMSTGTITDSTGVVVTRTSGTSSGYPTLTIAQASGVTETYTFNASRVSEYTDGKGIWQYQMIGSTYNPFLFARIAPGTGSPEIYQLDFATARLSWTQISGVTTYYTHDSKARVTQIEVSGGATHQFTYDARGNVTQTRVISATAGTPADIYTYAGFPTTCSNILTCNKPDYTIDANGNQTDYTYSSTHGGTLTVTSPAAASGGVRPETRYGYTSLSANYKNGSGTVIAGPAMYRLTSVSECTTTASCSGTSDEVKTTITYGANDALLPLSVTTGAGDNSLSATTATTYYPTGDVKTVDGPLSGTADTTRAYYDSERRQTGVIGPDPDGGGTLLHRAKRTAYDSSGRVSAEEAGTATSQSDTAMSSFSALEKVEIDYDAQNRVEKVRAIVSGSTATVTQYSYTNAGKADCTAIRMTPSTYGSLPGACTSAATGDRITQQGYDSSLRVVSTTEGVDSGAPATTGTITYTALNQVGTMTDGEGNTTTVEYDGFGRPYKQRYPSTTKGAGTSSTTDYQELTYDPAGNVINRRLRDGTSIAYNYDDLGRLKAKNLPGSEPDVTYGYDLLGRMTSAVNSTATLGFTYDALGRNITQTGPHGTVYYQYDAAGRRIRLTWPDTFYVTYDYSAASDLTVIRENGATSGVGVLGTYDYDNLGRRVTLTRGNGTVTSYNYDGLSRLSSLSHNLDGSTTTNDVTTSFNYNPAHGIASLTRTNDLYAWPGHANVARGYTSNGLNQLTASGGVSLGYDARGNITSSGSNSYGYSSENLLTSATVSGLSTSYEYDPLLRLYRGSIGSVSQTAVYDGGSLITNYYMGTLVVRNVWGPGVDEPLVEYAGSGTSNRTFFHADERGSVVARSNSSGFKTAINSYDEYGIPASTNAGAFQYTGQNWIPQLGMYYYKARFYSPTLGRFMQTDPIGYGDGPNMYAYVGNDPVNHIDPTGLMSMAECSAIQAFNAIARTDNIIVCGGGPSQPRRADFDDRERFITRGSGWEHIPDHSRGKGPTPPSLPPIKPLWDKCSAAYKAADWGFWAIGLLGDGIAIGGILTANPALIGLGKGTSWAANAASGALHLGGGDATALTGDAAGMLFGGLKGGGNLMRKGMNIDAGRNAGQYAPNHPARRRAQDAATQNAQGRLASGVTGGDC